MTKSRKALGSKLQCDVAIIGAGPAGISALLWARKLGLNALLIEKEADLGGQLNWIYNMIADYPGRKARNGGEMLRHFKDSLGDASGSLLLGTAVERLDVQKLEIKLSSGRSVDAKTIFLAMGVRRRRLKIPGEREFEGKGILISGAKQRRFVKGKSVAIIGGGDAAFENALILAERANRVYLIHRREQFTARPEFVSHARRDRRIEIITNTILTAINGDDHVRSISVKNKASGASRVLEIDALLIRIGVEPNTEMIRGQLKLDRSGYIVANLRCETSQPNVFAIGDIANPLSPTIATAVGTGAGAVQMIAKSPAGGAPSQGHT